MNRTRLALAVLGVSLVAAIPAAASHESFSYDPPPESGSVVYDAAPVQVPFSVDPAQVCVDPPAETATVAGDTVTIDPPQRCVDPPVVNGTVAYDAPAVDVPYTHDPPPRDVQIPDAPPPAPEFSIFEESGTSVVEIEDGFRATIPGAADANDTAYAQRDMGASGVAERLFTRSVVKLNQDPVGNISVFQVRDVEDDLVYEVYVLGSNNTIGLFSPAGGLRSTSLNLNAGVVAPIGTAVRVEVSALKNDSVIVRLDGVDKSTQAGLTGATTSNQRFLRAGIDHYDGTSTNPVSVDHTFVGSGSTWLGNPSPPPPPPPPSGEVAWNGDWETGSKSQYGGVEFCGTFDGVPSLDDQLKVVQSIDGVQPAQGSWFAKTLLPPDQDPASDVSKCYGGSSGSRILLRQHDPIELRGEGYNTCVTWATRFPSPGYGDEWVFAQWHQNGGQWPKPLDMDPGVNDINARIVIDKAGGGLDQLSFPFASPLVKNVWHVFVACTLFSTGPGGKFDLWHGIKGQSASMTKIVTHNGRTLMEPPADKAHFMIGLYGPDSGGSWRWVYHDAAREFTSASRTTDALVYAESILG